jgi:hypothetical protein
MKSGGQMKIVRRIVDILLVLVVLFLMFGLIQLPNLTWSEDMVKWAKLNLWVQKGFAVLIILTLTRLYLKKQASKSAEAKERSPQE